MLLLYFAKGYPKLNLFEEGNNYIIKAPYDNFFYFLAERVLRYFQPQGVEMQYDKDTQEITLKAPKALMLAVLRHIETIARRSF